MGPGPRRQLSQRQQRGCGCGCGGGLRIGHGNAAGPTAVAPPFMGPIQFQTMQSHGRDPPSQRDGEGLARPTCAATLLGIIQCEISEISHFVLRVKVLCNHTVHFMKFQVHFMKFH